VAREPLLSVEDLQVRFWTRRGTVHAVNGISFDIAPGETLGIVGESGCGKSVTSLAILGLLSRNGRVESGKAVFQGQDLVSQTDRTLRSVRGKEIAMIFQDPMTSLNPVLTVGRQIREALETHFGMGRKEAEQTAAEALDRVGIPSAKARIRDYPHQFSGGMRQRAMIAMALACKPKLLIADEPTTALDVTIQAQIIEVLKAAQHETGAAIILITHDLGLIAELADRVVVMYAGRVVEMGDVFTIFEYPRHPYTLGLMNSLAKLEGDQEWLQPIPGQPPSLVTPPPGCAFHPRCMLSQGRPRCREEIPPLREVQAAHVSACHFAEELVHEPAPLSAEATT
jgi:oligopeptide/dipeptide ABC transporter ATP-binding protein